MACSSSPSLPPKLRILPSGMSCSRSGTALPTDAARSVTPHRICLFMCCRQAEHEVSSMLPSWGQHLGGTMVCWLGLCMALASFASSLLHAMPADIV